MFTSTSLHPFLQTLSSSLPISSQTMMTETMIKCTSSSLRRPQRPVTGRGPYIHVSDECVRWDALWIVCLLFDIYFGYCKRLYFYLGYRTLGNWTTLCYWPRFWDIYHWVLCCHQIFVEVNVNGAQRIEKLLENSSRHNVPLTLDNPKTSLRYRYTQKVWEIFCWQVVWRMSEARWSGELHKARPYGHINIQSQE